MNLSAVQRNFPAQEVGEIMMGGKKGEDQVFPFPGHAWGFAGLQGYGIGRLGDERATACPPTLDKVARFFSPPAGWGVKTRRSGRDVAGRRSRLRVEKRMPWRVCAHQGTLVWGSRALSRSPASSLRARSM